MAVKLSTEQMLVWVWSRLSGEAEAEPPPYLNYAEVMGWHRGRVSALEDMLALLSGNEPPSEARRRLVRTCDALVAAGYLLEGILSRFPDLVAGDPVFAEWREAVEPTKAAAHGYAVSVEDVQQGLTLALRMLYWILPGFRQRVSPDNATLRLVREFLAEHPLLEPVNDDFIQADVINIGIRIEVGGRYNCGGSILDRMADPTANEHNFTVLEIFTATSIPAANGPDTLLILWDTTHACQTIPRMSMTVGTSTPRGLEHHSLCQTVEGYQQDNRSTYRTVSECLRHEVIRRAGFHPPELPLIHRLSVAFEHALLTEAPPERAILLGDRLLTIQLLLLRAILKFVEPVSKDLKLDCLARASTRVGQFPLGRGVNLLIEHDSQKE